jgi:hypothetical protein
MALTYTVVGLQTQCSAVATAIDAGNYASARAELAKALLILAGIPQEVSGDEFVVKMRKDLVELKDLLSDTATASTTDNKRFIRAGLSHG